MSQTASLSPESNSQPQVNITHQKSPRFRPALAMSLLVVFTVLAGYFYFHRFTNSFKTATLASASGTYYLNFPINDPLRIKADGLSESQLKKALTVTPQIDFNLGRVGEYFEITPKNGLWPRNTRFKIEFANSPKSLAFTTSGSFQVSQSVRGSSIDPSSGFVIRFNYRLKDPEAITGQITISPQIPLVVKKDESVSEKEVGMVYRISSPQMKYSQSYAFSFNPNILSDLEEKLGQEIKLVAATISNPNLPSLKVASGYYEYTLMVVPKSKRLIVPIQAKNTTEVDIKLYQITPAQAINFLVYTEPEPDSYWSRQITHQINLAGSAVKWVRKIETGDLDEPVDMGQMPVGVYLLNLTASGCGEVAEEKLLVNVTDIGAVGVVGKFQNAFWMSSLTDGGVLSGANLRLYNLKDGARQTQSVLSGSDGLVKLQNTGSMDMAVAFYHDDVAFVPLAQPGSQMSTASSEGGYWRESGIFPENIARDTAYLYSDRPIYKPGDIIYAKAIVRTDADSQYTLASGEVYKLVLKKAAYDPNQKPVWEQDYSTNSLGTLSAEIKLPQEFKTGFYHLSLEKDRKSLSQIGIYIEEYRKPLYELTLSTESDQIQGSEKLKFNVKSVYSFGMPVKDREVEWTIYASDYSSGTPDDPYARSGENYFWEWWYDAYSYYGRDLAKGTAQLNSEGEAVVEVDLDPSKFNFIKQRLTIEVKQIDEQVSPERSFTHLTYIPNSYSGKVVGRGDALEDPFLTFELKDLQEKPVQDVEVILLLGNDEINRQKTNSEGIVVFKFSKEKNTRGELTLSWKDKSGKEQHLDTYYYTYTSKPVADLLSISRADAQINLSQNLGYKDKAQLQVSGGGQKHLVVLGRESVLDAFVVDNSQNKEFEITDALMPNFYLFSYSFKDGVFITGEKSVEPRDLADFKKINVSLSLDKANYQPGETVILNLKTSDAAGNPVSSEVSLGVVDKSIYQLKKKAEKPIHPYFYKKRYSRTMVSESLSGIKLYLADGKGGGGGPDAQVRSKFADTAFYKPDIITDSEGAARVEFKLPDNITTWMMSAYAVNKDTFVGQAEKEFLSTKDVFAMPIFPQFVTTGDNVWFRSLIGNSGESPRKVNASFAFGDKGPVNNPTQTMDIAGNSTKLTQWEYRVTELDAHRDSTLLISEKDNVILDGLTLTTPIRSQGITIPTRQSGIGASNVVPGILTGADTGKTTASLFLHGSILGYINDILSYQAGYPYGCVEQTMSKFYPTLLVKKYMSFLSIQNGSVVKNLDEMVQAGLERLQKFQHEDGGWGLWEHDTSSPYYTTYVLTGLLDLQGSFKLPSGLFEGGQKYLEDQFRQKRISDRDMAKALNILAKLGSSVMADSSISFPDLAQLDDQQLAETTIAYAALGSQDTTAAVNALKNRAISAGAQQVKWAPGNDPSHFAHENLSTALAIQALLLIEPKSELIPQALNYLNTHRNMYVYGSTYTNAQVVKAFVEYVRLQGLSATDSTVTVVQEGKTLFSGKLIGAEGSAGPIKLSLGKELTITHGGTGVVLWEVVTDNMFPGKLEGRQSQDFSIERSYKNITRNDGSNKVGDLFEVRLTVIKKGTNSTNLVIEDRLPAGLEAVNPRLDNEDPTASPGYSRYSTERYVDRVLMFPSYQSQNGIYTYLARAYLPGTYIANPATVALMYTPSEPAFSPTSEIAITE